MPEPMSDERLAEIRERARRLGEPGGMLEQVDRLALLAEVERLRAELAERDQRLDQAAQDEAAITHEWDQARIAIEQMGRILDGGDDRG
jgi:hypothetical protein